MVLHDYDNARLNDLLYQMLETELGGELVYRTALTCAINDDLKSEWRDYLDETLNHQKVLLGLFEALGLDPDEVTPGRKVVKHIGDSLVQAMAMAKSGADARAAELVACECVVLAETKDHLNWELLGHVAKHGKGEASKLALVAFEECEEDEDHHLYHTQGWCRELWIESLGLPAVLPPPEERRSVETALGAARAEQQRDQML